MGTTTTQETTIPGRGADESAILSLLRQITQDAGAQLGDLSGLAQGDLGQLGPTEGDRELVRKSIGATRDIAQREIESLLAELKGQLGEQLGARGVQGSSIEAVQSGILSRDAGRQVADLLSQAQGQSAQALMNLPGQRAGIQIGANQALFQRLIGAGGTGLNFGLGERAAQGTTTTTNPFGFADLAQIGANVGKTIATQGQG